LQEFGFAVNKKKLTRRSVVFVIFCKYFVVDISYRYHQSGSSSPLVINTRYHQSWSSSASIIIICRQRGPSTSVIDIEVHRHPPCR